MEGVTVCQHHGRAPQVMAAAKRRAAEASAKHHAIKKYEREGPVEVSGAEAVIAMLEERMGVQVKVVRSLDEIVAKLTAAEELRYEHNHGEQLRGELQAWIQLNQLVTKLGADYLKIGLDERKVRIAEAQARILIGVIQAIVGRLELTRDQKRLAAQVIPEELQRASIESGKLWLKAAAAARAAATTGSRRALTACGGASTVPQPAKTLHPLDPALAPVQPA